MYLSHTTYESETGYSKERGFCQHDLHDTITITRSWNALTLAGRSMQKCHGQAKVKKQLFGMCTYFSFSLLFFVLFLIETKHATGWKRGNFVNTTWYRPTYTPLCEVGSSCQTHLWDVARGRLSWHHAGKQTTFDKRWNGGGAVCSSCNCLCILAFLWIRNRPVKRFNNWTAWRMGGKFVSPLFIMNTKVRLWRPKVNLSDSFCFAFGLVLRPGCWNGAVHVFQFWRSAAHVTTPPPPSPPPPYPQLHPPAGLCW